MRPYVDILFNPIITNAEFEMVFATAIGTHKTFGLMNF